MMYVFSMIVVIDSWVYILVSKLVTLCTLYMYSFMYVNCISKKTMLYKTDRVVGKIPIHNWCSIDTNFLFLVLLLDFFKKM